MTDTCNMNIPVLESEKQFWKELNKRILSDLFQLKRGSLVSITSRSTLGEALQLLLENDFSSAPVLGEEIVGIIDCLDIAAYISQHHQLGESVLKTSVKEVMDFSKRDPLFPLYLGSPVEALFKILGSGIHRCPIVDGAGEMTSMISQLDVVDFLAKNLHKLTSISGKTLAELGLLKPVFSVKESDSVIDCITSLSRNKVSAVAILTEEGEVIGAFSSHDVKYLIKHKFSDIYGPLSKYLNTAVGWPVSLQPTSTFGDAIRKLQTDLIHRLWIVGDESEPKGVVALTDIMKIVADVYYKEGCN